MNAATNPLTSPVALVDADNFYCSCERVFNPRLHRKPLVVLSNNDGCVISRSREAKALKIAMGAPAFRIEHLTHTHGVKMLSSNYALYGDLSRRVVDSLQTFTPDLEIYSIDEAFLGLAGFGNPGEYARRIKQTVYRWTGIPVTIGLGETKTLAKVATYIAKGSGEASGVLDLTGSPDRETALARTPVEEVWGIGPASTRKLHAIGIRTARDLRDADDRWVRRNLTIVGLRIVHELRGMNCLPIDLVPPRRRCITYSRSFGQTVRTLDEVREAVAFYTSRAAEKIRKAGLAAGVVTVFVMTNRFDQNSPQYSNSVTVELAHPTDATPELLERALTALGRIHKDGFAYKKAGVMLTELRPADQLTLRLYENDAWQRSRQVSVAMDKINQKHGRETIRLGVIKPQGKWSTKFERRSPRYTTRWDELPLVKA